MKVYIKNLGTVGDTYVAVCEYKTGQILKKFSNLFGSPSKKATKWIDKMGYELVNIDIQNVQVVQHIQNQNITNNYNTITNKIVKDDSLTVKEKLLDLKDLLSANVIDKKAYDDAVKEVCK